MKFHTSLVGKINQYKNSKRDLRMAKPFKKNAMDAQLSNNWNVLIVRPKTEKAVGIQLSSLGFETCVPIQKQVRQWSDRRKVVESVLFHNYVFIEANNSRRNEVYSLGNVVKYLQYLNKPAVLRPMEVALIKQLSGLQTEIEITYDQFKIGDFVEISSGPLSGQKGYVSGFSGSDHIQLSISSLNCFANVKLGGESIRIVPI